MFLKTLNKDKEQFEEAYAMHNSDSNVSLLKEYVAFSRFMQDLFIPEGGYIIDTGNFETVNLALLPMIINRIKKHPLIWKLFFRHY